jgi:hypothetical protein
VQTNALSSTLSQNVQLSLEQTLVKLLRVGHLGSIAGTIGRGKDDKRLSNDGLTRFGGRSKKCRVDGRPSPSQDSEAQRLGNIFQLPLGLLKSLLVGLKEQVSHGVLAQGRQLNVLLLLKVLDEEPVGDGCHDTSTITISCIRTHGTTVGHVTEEVTGITNNLVARLTLDVAVSIAC